jgi:hypothetical protein
MTLDSEVATLPPEKPVVKMPWRLQKGLSYIKIDAHVKSPFHMDLGIKVFRDYELFKLVIRILNWRIL